MSEFVIETEEQLLTRHRKENRDLVATVTGLKKQATKSKKKEVQRKCVELEQNLKEKHQKELNEFKAIQAGETLEDDEEEEFSPEKLLAELELEKKEQEDSQISDKKQEQGQANGQEQPSKGPKRNRQKERLAKRAALIEEQRQQAQDEANVQPNFKEMEQETIKSLCDAAGLTQFDIKPDGNCLFASIADQLDVRQGIKKTIQELRTLAASHIRNDPDTFIPYMFDETTMTLKNIDEYTATIENTAAWGADLEILALSKEFDCPISVLMSGRSTLKINEEGSKDELKLVFYKHSYALGEHYNSLRDS